MLEIRDQTGIVAPELAALPELPLGGEHLWAHYLRLDRRRQVGFSINAFSWSDIQAYCGLRKLSLARWEVDAICSLDDAYLQSRLDETSGTVKGAKSLGRNLTGKKGQK